MNPLFAIAASLFPELIKLVAGDKSADKANGLIEQVIKAVTDTTRTKEASEAKTKVDTDPKVATELQAKLAEIAVTARKAELDAAQQERETQIKAEKARAEADLEFGKQSMEETSRARAALLTLAQFDKPLGWTPSIISYMVISGFFLIILLLMFNVVRPAPAGSNGEVSVIQILNICIGAIAAAFATVINFWLGSSLGSRSKDAALTTSAAVTQAKELSREDDNKGLTEKKSPDGGGPRPSPEITGPIHSIVGKMSVFGGPRDTGMRSDEGLALFEPGDVPAFKNLFLDEQPAGTTGLGRRLDPSAYYLACRWAYGETPRSFLRTAKVRVSNPRTGRSATAQPVDWGPNERTGRVADLSPGLAAFLDLATDDVCQVDIPLPASVLTSSTRPTGPHLRVLSQDGIENLFGKFQYSEAAGGRITIAKSWIQENIVSVKIPQLAHFNVSSVECHKLIADKLVESFAEVEKQGLLNRILAWDGLFVPRHKSWNPARTLSAHSWAIAFDINARWNGYGSEPAPKGGTGSVVELVPIFESFGFAWGGYFSGDSRDGMHFECCKL